MTEAATLQHALNRFLDPGPLDGQRLKVCSHLQACRTEAMGAMELACNQCGSAQRRYHSCRDRHCPQCQGRATRQWSEREQDQLLPVPYYHLVFTLPHALNGWVALHPQLVYRLLFRATWETLRTFGEHPRRLGGRLGMTAVLHTWGQNLTRHVHLHCLVPGGALTEAGQWRGTRGHYLFPVKALSRRFRGRMVVLLREASNQRQLHRVTRPGEVDALLNELMRVEWVVYARDCLSHRESVVRYLARYTHRIALTNARLVAVTDAGVQLRYKDYRHGGRSRILCLEGHEFVRRFLLHILPKGFMRGRHYGFLANCCRRQRLQQIRGALAEPAEPASAPSEPAPGGWPCPSCKQGQLRIVSEWWPAPGRWHPPG